MADQMLKILKNLKAVQPGSAFTEKTRAEILSISPRRERWLKESLMSTAALAFTTIIFFLTFGGLNYLNLPRPTASVLSSLDQKNLMKETRNLTIEIQLAEARYNQEEALAQVNRALNELSF